MALHDYVCGRCGATLMDIPASVDIGAVAAAPDCPDCRQPMTWIPQVGRMDAGSVKGASFQAFDTFDTFGRPTRVTNFHDLRRIERESERAHANGDGQLLRWRDLSQDRSNRDVHSIARQPDRPMELQDQPRIEATSKFAAKARPAPSDSEAAEPVPFSLEDTPLGREN